MTKDFTAAAKIATEHGLQFGAIGIDDDLTFNFTANNKPSPDEARTVKEALVNFFTDAGFSCGGIILPSRTIMIVGSFGTVTDRFLDRARAAVSAITNG